MTIQEQIKERTKTAIKQQDYFTSTLLKVILGEFDRIGKNVSDEDAIRVISKMKKDALLVGNQAEVEILDQYLPRLMSESKIEAIIDELIASGLDHIGKLMGAFNKEHKGKADNAIVSKIIKEKLAQ